MSVSSSTYDDQGAVSRERMNAVSIIKIKPEKLKIELFFVMFAIHVPV